MRAASPSVPLPAARVRGALGRLALTRGRSRPALAGAWLLSGATLAAGLLTYAFHVLAARSLGPAAYGSIAILWAAVFVTATVLFRPIEQTMSRAMSDRLTRSEEVGSVLRSVGLVGGAMIAAVGLSAALAWNAVGEALFLGDHVLTAMFFAGVALYGAVYLVRGLLSGSRWFGGYGLILVADAVARLAIAAPLVVFASEHLAAVAAVGAATAGILVPLYAGRARLRRLFAAGTGSSFRIGAALAFAGPASIIALSDQIFVNGGPLLVIVGEGSGANEAAGVVFAATMLVRVPAYIFQGLAASLLPNLTQLQAQRDGERFRQSVLRAAGFFLFTAAFIVAAAAITGPEAMRLLYGAGFDAGRLELALLAAGVGCYLAAAVVSQALLALDRGRSAAAAAATASVSFVALYALLPGGALARISVAFAVAAAIDLALLAAALLVRRRQKMRHRGTSGQGWKDVQTSGLARGLSLDGGER
jgi:O-antigen/teichoic acid export membrane protein